METPRLRGKAPAHVGPYPLGKIPDEVLRAIARKIVYRIATGIPDIKGDDFGDIFAAAVGGEHRASPLGIADVVRGRCGWSVKTLQNKNPYTMSSARLISGRNDPRFSYGINDPFRDVAATGKAVLGIWNERVEQAREDHSELRTFVLARNMETLKFLAWEYEAKKFFPDDYRWELNKNQNFIGRSTDGRHCFTWQNHGGQFTIIGNVPPSDGARRLSITRTPPR